MRFIFLREWPKLWEKDKIIREWLKNIFLLKCIIHPTHCIGAQTKENTCRLSLGTIIPYIFVKMAHQSQYIPSQ